MIMSSPPVIALRVTPEMKTLLRALAEREQITESALVRQLLEAMLRRSALEGFPKLEALEKLSRDARLSIRLAPE
jgi:predicted DNA-binding protein